MPGQGDQLQQVAACDQHSSGQAVAAAAAGGADVAFAAPAPPYWDMSLSYGEVIRTRNTRVYVQLVGGSSVSGHHVVAAGVSSDNLWLCERYDHTDDILFQWAESQE